MSDYWIGFLMNWSLIFWSEYPVHVTFSSRLLFEATFVTDYSTHYSSVTQLAHACWKKRRKQGKSVFCADFLVTGICTLDKCARIINLAILCRWIGFLFVGLSLRCNRLKYNPFPLQFFLEILIWTYSLVSGVDVSLLRFTCEVYLFLHCTEPRGDNLIKASSSLNIEIPFLIPKNIVSAPKWDEWVVERSEKIKDKD